MEEQNARYESKFLLTNLVIVSILGFAAWMSLTNPFVENTAIASDAKLTNSEIEKTSSLDLKKDSSVESQMAKSEDKSLGKLAISSRNSVRSPASIEGSAAVHEIRCGEPPKSLSMAGAHLRLKLVGCRSQSKAQVSVKNISNGFTASVFQTAKAVTTDYIDLVQGHNQLKIEISEEKNSLREISIDVNRL